MHRKCSQQIILKLLNDITDDIMNIKKIRKLKKQISQLRNRLGNIQNKEIKRLAKACGRKRVKRGTEDNYESTLLPRRPAISIPNHPGSLGKYVAGNILDDLEEDLFWLEENLQDFEE